MTPQSFSGSTSSLTFEALIVVWISDVVRFEPFQSNLGS